MVDERIAARRAEVRDERRRRRLRRTVLVVTLLVVVALLALVERSDLVALAEIRVEGTERLDAREVRRATGLELGTSTLRLPLDRAREQVEALPLVHSATVGRLDPLTVEVRVVERVPVAVVEADGDRVLVDDEGVVLATGAEEGLARIVLTSGQLPEPGARLARHPAAANAHSAWGQLPGALRSRVERYVARAPDELTLELTEGVVVQFGRADRVDEKARALGAVLEDLEGREVAEIDVRAPSRPTVVPAS